MKKIIKTMPLMALLLGAGIFSVDAAFKASTVQTNQEWLLNTSGNPTNPGDYTSAPADTRDDCSNQNENVCVIIAPANAQGQPNFQAVPDLEDALASGMSHDNIVTGPYTP